MRSTSRKTQSDVICAGLGAGSKAAFFLFLPFIGRHSNTTLDLKTDGPMKPSCQRNHLHVSKCGPRYEACSIVSTQDITTTCLSVSFLFCAVEDTSPAAGLNTGANRERGSNACWSISRTCWGCRNIRSFLPWLSGAFFLGWQTSAFWETTCGDSGVRLHSQLIITNRLCLP